jgi:riboflavin synthase
VTGRSGGALAFDVMAETVRRTTLAGLRSKDKVNLENSIRIGGGMDGHFVLGHVDCVGTFKEAREKGEEFIIQITIPDGFDHLLVEKGSVTIDGVSLTVGEVEKRTFCVYLIPHTLKETTLGSKGPGSRVNVEFDIIGKYVAKLEASARPGITEDFLRARGF